MLILHEPMFLGMTHPCGPGGLKHGEPLPPMAAPSYHGLGDVSWDVG